MIRLNARTALVCLLALAVAGCAVELPKSAFPGFRLAPADDAAKGDVTTQRREAPEPVAAD